MRHAHISRAAQLLLVGWALWTPGVLVADDPVVDRVFDRVWQEYLPTLQTHFIRYLDFDDATFDQLARQPHASVRLRLHLDRHGRVHTVDLLEAAGPTQFTESCLNAARRMGRLPHLPQRIHHHGRRTGLDFVFATQK